MAGSSGVLASLIVNIEARTTKFVQGLSNARKESKQFADGLKGIGGGLKSFAGGFGLGAIGGLLGAGGIAAGLKSSLDAFAEDERAGKILESQLRATGGAANLTADEIKGLATELQNTTRFADEVTVGAANVLTSFKNIKGDTFKSAIKSAQDLATVMGTDLESATVKIGKALNNPIQGLTALQKIGVTFTAGQKEQIKTLTESGRIMEAQKIILDELAGKFGGAAAADAKTFTGSIDQMKNAIGELQESIGGLISNNGTGGLVGWLTEVAKGATTAANALSGKTDSDHLELTKLAQQKVAKAQQQLKERDTQGARETLRSISGLKGLTPKEVDSLGLGRIRREIKDLEDKGLSLSGPKDTAAFGGLATPDDFKELFKLTDDLKKRGKSTFEETRTEAEKYKSTLADLERLLKVGAIDQDTFNRAKQKAQDALDRAEQKNAPKDENKISDTLRDHLNRQPSTDLVAAVQGGTAEFYRAAANRQTANPVEKNTKDLVTEEKKANLTLQKINTGLATLNGKLAVAEIV